MRRWGARWDRGDWVDPNQIALIILGMFMTVAVGLASWALKSVVELTRKHAALQSRVEVESEDTNRRLIDTKDWTKEISTKIDKLMSDGCGFIKRCRELQETGPD